MKRGGRLTKLSLAQLRPSQMALGYAEVAHKRKEWSDLAPAEAKRFLKVHRFPAVRGPDARYYLLDHHHLARALQIEKIETVVGAVMADLSHLSRDAFWKVMLLHQWAHPYDKDGKLRGFSDIPKKLKQLPDDPYRSLAAKIKGVGNFHKDAVPFVEFLWADFFRRRIPKSMLRKMPEVAIEKAETLARSRKAAHFARGLEERP